MLVVGQNTTDTSFSSSLSSNQSVSILVPGPNPLNSPLTTSGTLWCYQCKEIYKPTTAHPLKSPCLNNLSKITIRQCGPEAKYCKVCSKSGNKQYNEMFRPVSILEDHDDNLTSFK